MELKPLRNGLTIRGFVFYLTINLFSDPNQSKVRLLLLPTFKLIKPRFREVSGPVGVMAHPVEVLGLGCWSPEPQLRIPP